MVDYPQINKTYSGFHGNMSKRTANVCYIVIHYTGTMASASNNCIYFKREGAATNSSADFFIDRNGDIYQYNSNLYKYNSWHCNGGKSYGATNNNSIGIECVSDGRDFSSEQIDSLTGLVHALMCDFKIDKNNVIRHYDCNSIRKHCPAPYIDNDKWNVLHNKITGVKKSILFPLPNGHWFGMKSNDNRNHSGYYNKNDRPSIMKIQSRVGVSSDGYYGKATKSAVVNYQTKNKLAADGLVGVITWNKMFG